MTRYVTGTVTGEVCGRFQDSQWLKLPSGAFISMSALSNVQDVEPPYTDPEFEPGMVVKNADDPSDARRWFYDPGGPAPFFWLEAGGIWHSRESELPAHLTVVYAPSREEQ